MVNETTFSEEALEIALENDLTILGTSDIHGLTDWAHQIATGSHRPMTFVHVTERTPEAVKRGLFELKTVVWFNDLIIGKEAEVSKLVKENIHFGKPTYAEDKTILIVELTNESSLPFQMEYTGEYSFHQRSSVFTLPRKTSIRLQVKTISKKQSIILPFRILNAVIGSKQYLEHQFLVK